MCQESMVSHVDGGSRYHQNRVTATRTNMLPDVIFLRRNKPLTSALISGRFYKVPPPDASRKATAGTLAFTPKVTAPIVSHAGTNVVLHTLQQSSDPSAAHLPFPFICYLRPTKDVGHSITKKSSLQIDIATRHEK